MGYPDCIIDFNNKSLTCELDHEFYKRAKGADVQTRTADLSDAVLNKAREASLKLKALYPSDQIAQYSPLFWQARLVETKYDCLLPDYQNPGQCLGKYRMSNDRYEMMFCIKVDGAPKADRLQQICQPASESSHQQIGSAIDKMESEIGLESLHHPDAKVRLEAARWAKGFYSDAALNTVLPLLQSNSDEKIRNQAAGILGLFQDSRAEKALLRAALKDRDEGVRYSVLEALMTIGTRKTIGVLTQSLQKGPKDFSASCKEWWNPKEVREGCVGGLRDKAKSVVRHLRESLTAKKLAFR